MKHKIKQPRLRNGYRWRVQLTVFVGVLLALLATFRDHWRPAMPADPLTGTARIIDGDTVIIARETIRLAGIDAPERNQMCERDGRSYACGVVAGRELDQLIAGRTLTCRLEQRDRYNRLLAVCQAGDVDLNRRMVETGWAVGYRRYGDAESQARQASKGLWRGTFERPRDFRSEQGMVAWWASWWPW